MSKITSWDRSAYDVPSGKNSPHTNRPGIHAHPCRVVLWPKGAPDPSTVPHANEKVTVANRDGTWKVENGIPQRWAGSSWCLDIRSDLTGGTHILDIARLTRIPDSPTIEVGGKQYREDDVIERCAELEEV